MKGKTTALSEFWQYSEDGAAVVIITRVSPSRKI